MGSSPIRLRVIHEHGSGKAVRTFPWPSVPEPGVLITLEPETVERLLSSGPRSGASPSTMTHHDLDLSIRFPSSFPLSPVSPPSFVLISSTLDPGRADTIVPPYSHPESNCSSPGQVFFRPLSILSALFPHSPLTLGTNLPVLSQYMLSTWWFYVQNTNTFLNQNMLSSFRIH